jgi:HSP20 family molecular chaperone IbpA
MNTNIYNDKQRLFIASLNTVPASQRWDGDTDWFPALDVTETSQEYVFEVDVPGLKLEAIKVTSDNDVLSISGQRLPPHHGGRSLRVERPSGTFVRRLALPPDARSREIHASYSDGVLELRLPRSRPDDRAGYDQAVVLKTEEAAL